MDIQLGVATTKAEGVLDPAIAKPAKTSLVLFELGNLPICVQMNVVGVNGLVLFYF